MNTQVFEAFLRNDFRNKPGSLKVLDGRYIIMDARNEEIVVTKTSWEKIVGPGSDLIMSVITRWSLAPLQCAGCETAIFKSKKSKTHWYVKIGS